MKKYPHKSQKNRKKGRESFPKKKKGSGVFSDVNDLKRLPTLFSSFFSRHCRPRLIRMAPGRGFRAVAFRQDIREAARGREK